MSKVSRRDFIGATIGATAIAGAGLMIGKQPRAEESIVVGSASVDRSITKPTDSVRLGKSGLTVSLVGIGTGSMGWGHSSNQTRLGQEAFTRLTRHALDSGITFFDLADQYGSNPYFRSAMKGVPRDRYVIQTKTNSRDPQRARADIDRFLKELDTDHIDSLIIHCVTEGDWTTRYRAAAASDWVQINQVRWNPRAAHMDADVQTLGELFRKMRARGQGMIGMKVVGQGDIVDGLKSLTPETCFRFQIASSAVDAFVVGVEKVDHIDEMLRGTQVALNEFGYRIMAA